MTGEGGAKRFYKAVSVAEEQDGHTILLDGRAVNTPAKARLLLPCHALAEAVASEWDAQGDRIDPGAMPMMSLAATTIDRVVPNREQVIAEIAGYGGSDLLCYRADVPETLASRQQEAWGPLLTWAESELGARLKVTAGLMPVPQSQEALDALRGRVAVHSDWDLTPLHIVTTISGSLVIGLAVSSGHLDAPQAFDLGELDETFQAELWGQDREAEDRRRRRRGELDAAERFMGLVRT